MSRKKKDPLRNLTENEKKYLEKISRSMTEKAILVSRAKSILTVAGGKSYQEAAIISGRKSGRSVSELVSRFNKEGIHALEPAHGGGKQATYKENERKRILEEFKRAPKRKEDGTATWSITTLQSALRKAKDGLPNISRDTIWRVLHESGFSWQKSQSWKDTGKVKRKRKKGIVEVSDPDKEAKKT